MDRLLKFSSKTGFQKLLTAGAISAFVSALIFRRNLDAEYSLLCKMGFFTCPVSIPESANAWIQLFHENPLVGLLFLGFFDLINFLLVAIIFLAMSGLCLREGYKTAAHSAAAFTTASVLFYLFSNPSLAIFSLSAFYQPAPVETQILLFSIARRLLQFHEFNSFSGAGIYPSFLLITIAGLVLARWMWQSRVFNRTSAVVGFLANLTGLSYYLFLIFQPGVVYLPLSVSAVFLLAWYLIIGRRLWILSKKHRFHLKLNQSVYKSQFFSKE